MNEGLHVLIVEDDDDHAVLMEKQLARFETVKQTSRASDGAEAIKLLSTDLPPDLVLLDLNLPGRDGCEVLGAIRKNGRLESLAVAVVTSSDGGAEEVDEYKSSLIDIVVKPVSRDQLASILKNVPVDKTDDSRPKP